ncbi:hypothetical protein CEY16_13520 [Halalkalibacillus sediminis]|uniref:Uncharacterized protein n=1 Tax=Halalkalibacillus sediminis TaxID=2018042 RepID=A0A2I0QRX9_9BACI|nr:hypothetical protein [Halalkalibacillus sediminis]PKR76830.1 hypothetical protein CEY16_13520 [Halalkalibacillus sediminis]
MTKTEKILIGLLTGSIVLNLLLYMNLSNSLQEQIQMNSNNTHSQINSLSGEFNDIRNQIQEINNEDQWITSEEFTPDVENSTPEQLQFDMEWSFSELEEDSEVTLLYREEGSGDWIEAPAEQLQGLNFRAQLKLSPEKDYEYQIYSEGETIKSGEAQRITKHNNRRSDLILSGGETTQSNGQLQSLHKDIEEHGEVVFPFHEIENMFATIHYQDGSKEEIDVVKVGDSEMEHETEFYKENNIRVWSLFIDSFDGEVDSIILNVEYADGKVKDAEIYPEETEFIVKFMK